MPSITVTIDYSTPLPSGLTWGAQEYDADGNTVGSAITTGFTGPDASGDYSWTGTVTQTAVGKVRFTASNGRVIDLTFPLESGEALANGPTVGELLTILRLAARNAGVDDDDETVYDLTEKHLAIRGILNHLISKTRCTNQLDTVSIAEDDNTADFSGISGFHPERLKYEKLYIDGENECVLPDLGSVLEARRCQPDSTGSPEAFAFTSEIGAVFWPTADDEYTLNVMWSPPVTAFTAGDEASNDVAVNVPRDLAETAVRTGGVVWLQHSQIENLPITTPLLAQYNELVRSSMGRGSIGGDHSMSRRSSRRTKWQCFTGE